MIIKLESDIQIIMKFIFQLIFIIFLVNVTFEFEVSHSIRVPNLFTYILINIIGIIGFALFFILKNKKSRREKMLELMSTSGSLQEKNMKILTENIHHELNTPVAIIQGMIKQLEFRINTENKEAAERRNSPEIRKCDFNFEEVYSAVDQINTVLQRMSNFKQFKYSNGNKSVNDIFKYSSNSMKVYKHSNFEIELSEELSKYSLTGTLGNGDLLNIISNHFRNSLEAKATKIIVDSKFISTVGNKGILKLFIVDNGSGLRDGTTGLILKEKHLGDVFKPYYSTKDIAGNSLVVNNISRFKRCWITAKSFLFPSAKEDTELRGVGLFLNKQLLLENGCDVKLRETSEKGTAFEIKINVVIRKK